MLVGKHTPADIGEWALVCHENKCLWYGKVKDVYSNNGLLLRCPKCSTVPQTNGFMADYAEWLRSNQKTKK